MWIDGCVYDLDCGNHFTINSPWSQSLRILNHYITLLKKNHIVQLNICISHQLHLNKTGKESELDRRDQPSGGMNPSAQGKHTQQATWTTHRIYLRWSPLKRQALDPLLNRWGNWHWEKAKNLSSSWDSDARPRDTIASSSPKHPCQLLNQVDLRFSASVC